MTTREIDGWYLDLSVGRYRVVSGVCQRGAVASNYQGSHSEDGAMELFGRLNAIMQAPLVPSPDLLQQPEIVKAKERAMHTACDYAMGTKTFDQMIESQDHLMALVLQHAQAQARQEHEKALGAELTGQTIPDVEGTEPRPTFAEYRRSVEALNLCLAALNRHDDWCGHRRGSPGDNIYRRAVKAAERAIWPVPYDPSSSPGAPTHGA